MASKGIRFHTWDARKEDGHGTPRKGKVSAAVAKEPFFFHIILSNNLTVAPSEGYERANTMHKTIASIWCEMAMAQRHPLFCFESDNQLSNADARKRFLAANPVRYTLFSVKPGTKTSGLVLTE